MAESPTPTMGWKSIGLLGNLAKLQKDYPHTHYEWGARFDTFDNILPLNINGWNGKTCIASITKPYLQGDYGHQLKFGTDIFFAGKGPDEPSFTHATVNWTTDGYFAPDADKTTVRIPEVFVRPFPSPWVNQGPIQTMDDFVRK